MPSRVMTPVQIERVASALTTMAQVLQSVGFPWPDEAKADLSAAYEALGVPMPFEFRSVAVEPEPEPAQETGP